VWKSAHLLETDKPDPLDYGWDMCDGDIMPVCTRDLIAPEDLVTNWLHVIVNVIVRKIGVPVIRIKKHVHIFVVVAMNA
jgi:hypothetical protein